MKRTTICAEMVKIFEGLRLDPYKDAVGILTVGYGHVVRPGDLFVYPLTPTFAEALLEKDLDETEFGVLELLKGFHSYPWELDALVSFAFNLGVGALGRSTLLKKFLAAPSSPRDAASEFSRWRYAGGRVLPGLVKRRRAEAVRFLGGDFPLVVGAWEGEGSA